jgi:hypothetical protein
MMNKTTPYQGEILINPQAGKGKVKGATSIGRVTAGVTLQFVVSETCAECAATMCVEHCFHEAGTIRNKNNGCA